MKKILLGIAAFSLIFTSCQKNEVADKVGNGDGQLSWGVYQGKSSRASELDNTALRVTGNNFPIHAYRGKLDETRTLYFDEILTCSTTPSLKWSTSIPRFIPELDPLQIYAYYATGTALGVVPGATYTAPALAVNDSHPTLEYAIQPTQVDLVAATLLNSYDTKIAIQFKHILSQINFGVKGFYGAKITISDIVVNNVFKDGVFSFAPNGSWTRTIGGVADNDYTYSFAGAATFTTPGGVETDNVWADTNDETNNTYILGDGGKWGPGDSEKIWYVLSDGSSVKGDDVVKTGIGATTALANSLILMPQDLPEGVTAAYVTFKYAIRDLKGTYLIGSATDPVDGKFDLKIGSTAPNTAYVDKWESNKRYVYIVDFTGYLNGQAMTFTVDVDDNPWENYDGETGTGIVLVSDVDGLIFSKYIKALAVGANHNVVEGNVFSDIAWNWSNFKMDATYQPGDTFTVNFAAVKFNGNTISVTPPRGFTVSADGGTTQVANIVVSSKTTTLTFTKQ